MFPRALFFWNYVFQFLYMADFCWPERQDGYEDGLLVHMPTKHERTQSTNQQAAQETAGPAGSQPQVRHRWLRGEKRRRQNSNFCLCNQKVRREAIAVWARDTPGWTAACTQVWRRETRRARPRAETPAPSRPSLKLEEAPPPPAASALHLNRWEGGVTSSVWRWQRHSWTQEAESHPAQARLCPTRCTGPRCWGPSRHGRGPS